MKIWAKTKEFSEGKFLVVRRDGSIPAWPHFVMGARDPVVPFALHAYANRAEEMGFDPDYCQSIRELAEDFLRYRRTEGAGDPDASPHRTDDPVVIAAMRGAPTATLNVRRERNHPKDAVPTPLEPPAGSTQGVPEARRFMLKLTCCGREADPPSRPMTWAEADAFRESYVSGPGVTSPERPRENGHVRSAIIVEASDVSVLETAAVAGVPEGKPDVLPEPPRRPTIAELEAILNSENHPRLVIRPDGEIRTVPHCPGCDGGCDLCRANPPVEPTTGQQETLATRRESEADLTSPRSPTGGRGRL